MVRDPSQAPSLWGPAVPSDTPDAPDKAQVTAPEGGVRGVSGSDTPPTDPAGGVQALEEAAEPALAAPGQGAGQAVAEGGAVKVGPGLGERLGTWVKESFTPPQIWEEDRPSLKKQYTYAAQGAWGPEQGWARRAQICAFWAVSLPTSAAAYAIEWIGERPARWITALVLLSLTYQLPYVPEVLGVLVRIPAWPITATWSALNLTN